MQFGLFTYSYSNNLGDEIQSLAAAQFLPSVDLLVERDRLGWYSQAPKTFIIFNGWFTREPQWPPPSNIVPLFVAFYAHRPKDLINRQIKPYFDGAGPIGCRSLSTVTAFQDIGVEAYFSGCLTLTLKRPPQERSDSIYAIDVETDLYEKLVPSEIKKTAIRASNLYPTRNDGLSSMAGWTFTFAANKVFNKVDPNRRIFQRTRQAIDKRRAFKRMALAESLLTCYSRAKLVITSRLHCAMPCLALGTPVILLRRGVKQDPRFNGLWQLARTYDENSSNIAINWATPEPNDTKYLQFAHDLKNRCTISVSKFLKGN